MIAAQRAEIPGYAEMYDPSLLADARWVSVAVVGMWLDVMASGGALSDDAIAPVVEGARRRATQGIGLEPLLRAYRVGIRVMWTQLISSPVWKSSSLDSAMGPLATGALAFADRLTTAVAAAYIDEVAHLSREREHRRSSLLNVILAGPVSEQHRALPDLAEPHCVIVAQVEEGASLSKLEGLGTLLERHAGARLWTVRHSSLVAVIFGSQPRAMIRERLASLPDDGRVLAFGIGARATSTAETRVSYAEAAEAANAGPALGMTAGRVYDHSTLAPVLALLRDREAAQRFAATALEPFTEILGRKWALPTLEAYFSRAGRTGQMAEALGLHANTVKYRMGELAPYLPADSLDGDQAATLLLAIRVHKYLQDKT
ncbi:helix-turn-helix domain-containing protein [soil metagenome]